ncbi:alpha/beta hydrolase family protein [Legionella brunensis]|uniref:Alpha/beta hydrolase family protein n=1 Tax=Legionella brunensis TaxID=29422 RepID=A0A0W0S3N5_9GAMM|nr:alpha/beta hydrolase [Legionella brunensis]KTC78183.1 Alpha/beta hydrolase family protein [Legionella brunensis]
MIRTQFIKLFFLLAFLFSNSFAAAALYPGEYLDNIQDKEVLVQFIQGEPDKPLVIFVPGDSHLARIAYGYPGGKPQDFLSYWLNKRGYSFAGVSYPLANPVYNKVYPQFNLQDWGQQIVQVALKLIKQNKKLPRRIIVLGWSMGGSIEGTVAQAAKQHDLEIEAFIGLAAVPPLPYIMQSGPFNADAIRSDHLAERNALYPWFIDQLLEQNRYNEHEIIPEKIYLSEFIGSIPTALTASGYHYKEKRFVRDIPRTVKEGNVFNFADTPWIALIVDDSPIDAKISLVDPATWNFLRLEMINHHYLTNSHLSMMTPIAWKRLTFLLNSLAQELTLTVHGNHFFFVGEKGAKETAESIDFLLARLTKVKKKLALVLNKKEGLMN